MGLEGSYALSSGILLGDAHAICRPWIPALTNNDMCSRWDYQNNIGLGTIKINRISELGSVKVVVIYSLLFPQLGLPS